MFDEYDESTAILPAVALKRNLPSGGKFIALDADGDLSLPSDWYLKIAAFAAEVMRGQREVEKTLPRKMLLGDYWGSRKRRQATSSSGSSGSTSTYVPNQAKAQEQVSSAFASAPTGAAAPAPADTGSWQDVKDTKDDEPPPPAYTLEAEEQATAPSSTDAPAATPTSQPPLSTVLTAGNSSLNRASTVSANVPMAVVQGSVGVRRSSSHCTSQPTPISPAQPLAPWTPPPATHRFAPPPSVPPSHTFSPPSMGPTYTPPHSPSSYNSAVSGLSNDFSRMNTGPLVSPPSSPTNPGNQSEFPFNRPTEAGQTHQYAHYTASQSTHQSEHVHSGGHGLPAPGPGGWTAPVAPPPATHSVSSQYSHHFSHASQTQQWGQPTGQPPTSGGSTAYMGNPGAHSPSPSPSSWSQPANPEHGSSPSEAASYPTVQSPWQTPQPATSTCAGVQQDQGQNPPTDQPGTLYGVQSQPGYYPGHAGTSYAPPPGPPQPPTHPTMSGASGSGPQTQLDPNDPNKRTSHTISKRPILIRFGTLY